MMICPNCKTSLEDTCAFCPFCGTSLASQNSQAKKRTRIKQNVLIACVLTAIVCTVIFTVIGFKDSNSTDKSESDGISFNNYTSNWSSYYNDDYGSSGGAFSDDSSTIFKNLDITNFSASPGFHGGQMSCKVTNNNPVMITGYISVNFYDYSEGLLYTQLISVPDVASGEAVVCSTLIPKDAFNVQYDYVDFSQGNLAVVD